MVPQGHLIAAQGQGLAVEGAPPQPGAETAGVFLLPGVEDDLPDLCRNEMIGHRQPAAQLGHRGKIHFRIAHFQRHGLQRKGRGSLLPQGRKQDQQRQRILPAGDADGDPVAGRDHLIIPDAAAHLGKQLLHDYQLPGLILVESPQKRKGKK